MDYNLLTDDLLWVIPDDDLLCLKCFDFDFFRVKKNNNNDYLRSIKNIYNILDIQMPYGVDLYEYCANLARIGYVVILLSSEKHDKPVVVESFLPDTISEKQRQFFHNVEPLFENKETTKQKIHK